MSTKGGVKINYSFRSAIWSDRPTARNDFAGMQLAEAIDIDFSSEVDIFISIYIIQSDTKGGWFFIPNNNQLLEGYDGEIFFLVCQRDSILSHHEYGNTESEAEEKLKSLCVFVY